MATKLSSRESTENEKTGDPSEEEKKFVLEAGWKVLFGFTTGKHVPVLSGAMLCATIAACTMPGIAIVYGLIFGRYTDYGAGKISSVDLISEVSRDCVIVTGLATLNWVANSFYFFFFLTFGELQAKRARNKMFDALIAKDMAWYDTRDAGIGSILPRIQM